MKFKLTSTFSFIFFILLQPQSQADWTSENYFKREHSLTKPYQGTGMTIPYWDFMGSTMVTNSYVRLTTDEQSRFGALWNSVSNTMRHWEIQVQFKIHGKGKDLFGDGMAVWYTRDRMKHGSVFGSADYFSGLVILVDTYSNHNGEHNHQHPYISAMVNNGSLHYDHDRDGTHTQLAGCEAKMRNVDHDTHIAIRYEQDTLTVFTDFEKSGSWKQCFSVAGVRLPTGYFFGLSAATGDLSDNHDVIAVRTYELLAETDDKEDRSQIIPSAVSSEAPRERIEDPKSSSMSGLKIFLYFIFGSVGVVACVIFSFMVYQKHKEKSRKRFY